MSPAEREYAALVESTRCVCDDPDPVTIHTWGAFCQCGGWLTLSIGCNGDLQAYRKQVGA